VKTARILSIDGGGIRGLVPATILKEWESHLGPMANHFHMITGTSTGGILAAGLAGRNTAEHLANFYVKDGPKIFSNTLGAVGALVGDIYSAEPLEASLRKVFGNGMLSQSNVDLLITAYEMGARQPRLFKSWRAQGLETDDAAQDEFLMTSVTRATSAAPTYFPPALLKNHAGKEFTMVDGGVFANNPAMCAYVAARRIYPDADNYLIVSLGTGALVKSYTYEQVAGWGIAGWAQPLLDIMFSGVSDTTSYQLDQLAPEVTQYRFQTDLTGASEAMDDVTPENLAALVKVATNTLNFNQKLMGELIETLRQPLPTRETLGYPKHTNKPAAKKFTKPPKLDTAPPKPHHEPAHATAPTIQPTSASEKGTAVGLLGGAALGGAIGGPIGAVAGAVVGGFIGSMSGGSKKA
jgi:hypothetical protein